MCCGVFICPISCSVSLVFGQTLAYGWKSLFLQNLLNPPNFKQGSLSTGDRLVAKPRHFRVGLFLACRSSPVLSTRPWWSLLLWSVSCLDLSYATHSPPRGSLRFPRDPSPSRTNVCSNRAARGVLMQALKIVPYSYSLSRFSVLRLAACRCLYALVPSRLLARGESVFIHTLYLFLSH